MGPDQYQYGMRTSCAPRRVEEYHGLYVARAGFPRVVCGRWVVQRGAIGECHLFVLG